jgi:hypothetical protein
MRFIYYCAPPNYGYEVRQWLSKNYPGRWIGCGREAPVSWPTRPPDLNPLDFKLWGYTFIKTKMCASTVDTMEELRRQIKKFASEINNTPGISTRLIVHYSRRTKLFVREYGGHFEHLL